MAIARKTKAGNSILIFFPMATPVDAGLSQEHGKFPLEISELPGKPRQVLILAFGD